MNQMTSNWPLSWPWSQGLDESQQNTVTLHTTDPEASRRGHVHRAHSAQGSPAQLGWQEGANIIATPTRDRLVLSHCEPEVERRVKLGEKSWMST